MSKRKQLGIGYPRLEKAKESLLNKTIDMVREFARVTQQEPDPELYSKLIHEEYNEFYDTTDPYYVDKENIYWPEHLKELADLVYVCYGYANAMGYDLDEAIRRVHENNIGRCVQPDGTIKRREDGKILKNKDYPKVDLSDLL